MPVKMKATEGQRYQVAWWLFVYHSMEWQMWYSGHTAEAQAVVGKGREKQKPVCVISYNQHMGYAAKIEVYVWNCSEVYSLQQLAIL
jgi:hypothetical protein